MHLIRPNNGLLYPLLCVLIWALLAAPATADVLEVRIDRREPVDGGRAFGDAGPYEVLEGRIVFAFDPDNPANGNIVDLDLAPRDADGRVRATGDLIVMQAVAPEKRSGTALVEVSNRGGRASLSYLERGDAPGEGLLRRRGTTIVWVGWQFDVPTAGRKRLRLDVPRAPQDITGLVRCDWVVDEPRERLPLGHRDHIAYEPIDAAGEETVLTERDGREAQRRVVPRAEWRFDGEGAIVREGGFTSGRIYELVYRAQEPAVVGLGLAAIRDTICFVKYDENCPFPARRGLAIGISQTGRFLRHFLYQGFNTGERGRQAFDGLLIHSAGAGRGSFNHRFAQPSRDAHRYSAFFYPTDLFPFTGRVQRDPLTGARDGLHARHLADDHAPKVFLTNTGYEYWGRAAALVHTSVDGAADVEPLPFERIYHLAGTQHFPWPFPPRGDVLSGVTPLWRGNPADILWTLRALYVALDEWVTEGVAPPESAYPRIDAGTLVPTDELRYPDIPAFKLPGSAHVAYRADYGPEWSRGIVGFQPPRLGPAYPTLVPQVDRFGNELGGIRAVEIAVPLATYLPWHLRGDGELDDFYGSFVPLPVDAVDGDERGSVGELYASREGYLDGIRAAVEERVEGRTMLEVDGGRAVESAGRVWDWVQR